MNNLLLRIFVVINLLLVAGCGMSQDEKERLGLVACAEMEETVKIQGSERVKRVNEVRTQIEEEPYLRGDDEIVRSISWGTCKLLVINDANYDQETNLAEKLHGEELKRLAIEREKEQKRLAIEKEKEQKRLAEERHKEYVANLDELKSKAELLAGLIVFGELNLTFLELSESPTESRKNEYRAKVFKDFGFKKDEEAQLMAGITYMRRSVDSQKEEGRMSRYMDCMDETLPELNELLLLAVAREYKPNEYQELFVLGAGASAECQKL